MIYLLLAFYFFQIGLFSIGGGYATISLIQKILVVENQWLTTKEFTDIITISQMTPGPLAVNSSTFVGLQVSNLLGAFIATVSAVISGCIIAISLYHFFQKNKDSTRIKHIFNGLEAVAIGLIASASLSILSIAFFGNMDFNVQLSTINWLAFLIFLAALWALRKWQLNPIILLIVTGLLGFFLYT